MEINSEICSVRRISCPPGKIRLKPIKWKIFLPSATATNSCEIENTQSPKISMSSNFFNLNSTKIKRNFLASIKLDNNINLQENDKSNIRISEGRGVRSLNGVKHLTERVDMKKSSEKIVLKLPGTIKRKMRYAFGDLKSFSRRVEYGYKKNVIRMMIYVRSNFNRMKNSNKFLQEKDMTFLKFNQILANTFGILNIETGLTKRIKILRCCKFVMTVVKKKLITCLRKISLIYIRKVILIQSTYKSYTKRKYITVLRKSRLKIIRTFFKYKLSRLVKYTSLLQKFYRGYSIRKRYEKYLNDIRELQKLEQLKLNYIIKKNINRIQKNAVRAIEIFWKGILEKREEKEFEKLLSTMPEECRELYRKFATLKKQTKNLKNDLVKLGENQNQNQNQPK